MIECRTKDFVSDFISVVKSLNSLSVAVLLPSLITKSSARRYTDFGLLSLLAVIRKKYLMLSTSFRHSHRRLLSTAHPNLHLTARNRLPVIRYNSEKINIYIFILIIFLFDIFFFNFLIQLKLNLFGSYLVSCIAVIFVVTHFLIILLMYNFKMCNLK